MRLSCPSCQTEYDVPDAALTGRPRTLRCVQCGYQWQSTPLQAPRPEPVGLAMAPPAPAVPVRMPEWQPPEPVRPVSFPAAPEPVPAVIPALSLAERAAARARRMVPAVPERNDEDDSRERFAALVESSRQNTDELDEPPVRRLPKPKQAKRANPILISILILLVAAVFAWIERAHIMHAWPPSARLFDAINRMIH